MNATLMLHAETIDAFVNESSNETLRSQYAQLVNGYGFRDRMGYYTSERDLETALLSFVDEFLHSLLGIQDTVPYVTYFEKRNGFAWKQLILGYLPPRASKDTIEDILEDFENTKWWERSDCYPSNL